MMLVPARWLGPQLMSERFQFTHRLYRQRPPEVVIRVWQMLHGAWVSAALCAICGVLSLASCLYYQLPWSVLQTCFLFGSVFLLNAHFIIWCHDQSKIDRLFTNLITCARILEERSNDEQRLEMMKMTRTVRFLWLGLGGDISFLISLYVLFPLQREVLACPLPFLPEGQLYFWIGYIVQTPALVQGPIGGFTFLAITFEVTLGLTSLFRVLGEQLENVKDRNDLNQLIHLHQLMLDSLLTFRKLASSVFFSFFLTTTCCLVLSTYILLKVSFEALMVFLIPSVLGFTGVPCFLAEMVATASEAVGHSAFRSAWFDKEFAVTKDLATVIQRCQRPSRLAAGMVGALGVAKFQEFLNRYYQFVQALLNLA